jgi:cytochrome c-type biogenesis protein CcmF
VTVLGDLAVVALVAAAGASAGASVVAWRRDDERWRGAGRWLLAAATVAGGLAVVVLARALLASDFSLAYVVEQSRSRGSAWYRLAGLWGGIAGSLLVWTVLLSGVGLVSAWRLAGRPARLGAVAQGAAAGVVTGFGLVIVTLADPFVILDAPVVEGLGLTPILEHPAMLYHPPLLYLGLAGLLAPFALTVGTAVAGELDESWAVQCRRWALVCWALLGFGMVAGAHWAYVEVGWGGFWAWDPVENTALLPWLAVTAAVHAGLLRSRRLNAWLIVTAFVVALLGTLLTRSGATQSVHAFAEDPAIGWALLVLVGGVAIGGAAAMVAGARGTWRADRAGPDTVAGPAPPPSGRARALSVQVVTTVLALVVVLVGTVYPLLRTLTGDDDVAAVDARFFSLFVGPLALVVLVLAGVGPRLGRARPLALGPPAAAAVIGLAAAWLTGWRSPFGLIVAAAGGFTIAASAIDLARHRRGGHLAHLGLAVLLVGIAGSGTGGSVSATVAAGGRVVVAGFEVANDGARVVTAPDADVQRVAAPVTVWRDGREVARLTPQLRVHRSRGDQLAETAVWSTPLTDVQVALRDAGDEGQALLQVHVRPLMVWVWWGGLLLVAGGAWAALSGTPRERQPRRVEETVAG